MIEVEAVTKRFDGKQALAGVEFVAEEGRVLALLGPNGAGKTTLVRILATLLEPDGGSVRAAGYDVVDDADRLRPLIGLTGQFVAVDPLMTGRENLEFIGHFHRLSRAERRDRAGDLLEHMSLVDVADQLVRTYSGGMRRRLDIGASLIGQPQILFLDEPTTSLDPRTRNNVWQCVEDLVSSGSTVLLTTQHMEEVERLADYVVMLDAGTVIAQGTVGYLKDRLGGDVLEARLIDRGDLDRAAAVMATLGSATPDVDSERRCVTMQAPDAVQTLLAVGQSLQTYGIALEGLGIRRPSLDDVFVTLTDHSTPSRTDRRVPDAEVIPSGPVGHFQRPTHGLQPRHARRLLAAAHDIEWMTKRNLLRTARTPRLVVISALQPALLLLLFRYVLGGAIHIPGVSYVDYIVPAIFIEAMMVGGMATAIGLADDMRSGIIDRFRSLQMAHSAVLAGRTIADTGRSAIALGLMVGLSVLVGFHFHSSLWATLAGLALVIIFGYCLSWVHATIGLLSRDPETAQVASMVPFFVLVFVSSAIVPTSTMPAWLQGFATHQPVSVTIDAVRSMLQGEPTHAWVWQSLLWSAGIAAVFSTLASHLYRNAVS